VKRASPSRGQLAPITDASALGAAYAAGGAAAVSVLTEPCHFLGSLEDLSGVAATVRIPVLRKDFVVDDYQVLEARARGAAAVLLIVAALEARALETLLASTAEAGLDALVEVHAADEARVAVAAHRAAVPQRTLVVGVNARNLSTLAVDPEQFAAVRGLVPDDAVAVAESGVRGPDDVRRLAGLGADAVLVGEHVATAPDPAGAVAELVAAGRPATKEP
jgi:indole-3-glycerol phosphate synthase